MHRILHLAIAVFLATVAAQWWKEHRWIADTNAQSHAKARDCEHVAELRWYFVSRDQAAAACEHWMVARVEEQEAACDFSSIVRSLDKVLAPPDSGAEPAARRITMELSTRHLACLRQLIADDTIDPARILDELRLAQRTYDDPTVQTDLGSVEGSFLLETAKRYAREGDVLGVLDYVIRIDAHHSLQIQNDADDLAAGTMAIAARARRAQHDFAGLYVLLHDAIHKAAPRAALQQRLVALKEAEADVPLFGAPLAGVADAPQMTLVASAPRVGRARVVVRNGNGFPTTIVLKGRQAYEREIPANGDTELDLDVGEYVELIRAGRSKATLFAILNLEAGRYEQAMTPDQFAETPPVSAEHGVLTRARAHPRS